MNEKSVSAQNDLLSRIQLSTSYHIKYFHYFARRNYGFREYIHPTEPTIFYGCYDENDYSRIKNHQGQKAILWGGTDILLPIAKRVMTIPNLIHLAQSDYIMRDLYKYRKKGVYVPFAPTVDERRFYPVAKGKAIYVYTNAKNPTMYGSHFYTQLIRQFPQIPFFLMSNYSGIVEAKRRGIDTNGIQYVDNGHITTIYQQCFLGLRLTKHDGISATVQELGLMGIPTVCNGNTPSCLRYSNLNDIITIINTEMKKIGTIDRGLAQSVKEHLQQCPAILAQIFGMELSQPLMVMDQPLMEQPKQEPKPEKKPLWNKKIKVMLIDEKWNKNKRINDGKWDKVVVYDFSGNLENRNKIGTRNGKIQFWMVSKIHGKDFIYKYLERKIEPNVECQVENHVGDVSNIGDISDRV